MPGYYIWTVGCQMNKAESERLGAYLELRGYQSVASPEEADLVVLNSCVVRQSAENRVVNKLANLRPLEKSRPELVIALTGCLVDSNREELQKRFPQVDYFLKPGELPDWLGKSQSPVLPEHPSVATFVPIMQGCNQFCSYCIVPYRRGRERSRPVAEVVAEIEELVRRGVREVTLLGQNVDAYGHDLPDHPDLAALLEELNGIEGLARLRFLTNHPKDMSGRLIDAVARLEKVCEQLYLPVQSGDNGILSAMRRGYTVEQYRELVSEIRRRVPEVALSTDVIVGFPSESGEQFEHTLELLRKLRFDTVHIAAYSPRPGTLAARKLEDDVLPAEKKERLTLTEELQKTIAGELNARLLGNSVEVLVEGKEKGKWWGRTRTGKLVFFREGKDLQGKLAPVIIEKTSPWSLTGRLK
ncbi:MAG: tRNA (N6-isopentenyl adenosine(37)-C2)-methylthiotransferase MiaB [Chloroflexota bacterium]